MKDATEQPAAMDDVSMARRFEREATRHFARALVELRERRAPGRRERYRQLLEGAIEHATRAITLAADESDGVQTSETLAAARVTLAKAHAAKAEDALQGAGQLSLSAQRAPTREACEDGWRRVEAIAAGAETSARVAAAVMTELENDAPRTAVLRAARAATRRAEDAARRAKRIVETRNHAHTFHTDAQFSFGEGWYLAAASVLAGVAIQVEPGKEGTARAETFLRDAGLGSRLQGYRSRPRAAKQTTDIVARAFRADAPSSQRLLRAAFLGDAPIARSVSDWVDQKLDAAPEATRGARKVALWIRDGAHHSGRNTDVIELLELTRRVERAGLVPVWTGDALRAGEVPDGVVDLILFWKDPIFRQADGRRLQLQFFEHLRSVHGLVGQLGVTTAGMDGPALMGLPTMYLTETPNVRMREWVFAVPGYREIVREDGYLDRVSTALSAWAERTAPARRSTAQ
jgi:hypothetical protein